jgi:hypothetical protein
VQTNPQYYKTLNNIKPYRLLNVVPHVTCRHIMMSSSNPPSMPQIAKLLAAAYPAAKVPPLTAPEWAVAFLAKFRSHKLGFDLPKFK